ncbi:MAG: gliding motility protein GldL [Bacteroidales bacterium]|jgi:gliding motility-associated protein GldL|nr:gliding motility protein GldL [Bacteroidales bacterium]MCR5036420.1 gliding motility protein GldL [Bacteroidales bacterium]
MSFKELSESRGYKNFMAKLYGIGASIVMIGALFKLTHMPLFGWSGAANFMLTLGLVTEAIIFFFSAFEPIHVEPDWSLVYPELWDMYHDDGEKPASTTTKRVKNNGGEVNNDLIADKLNDMFEKANINSATMERLSQGLNKLGENASKIADVSEAVAATSNYTKAMNKASETAMELDSQLSKTATNAAMFSDTSRKMNDTMALYLEKVNASASNTDALNHQLNDLSKRMTAMNTVYGNMLNAMNIKA